MSSVSKSDPVTIVGAGAFGLSTALHLAQAGYRNISVLDKGATIPSDFSAANDVNKILRVEYDDDFYTNLAAEALNAWKTPLFAPHYHQTGFLHCVSEAAPEKAFNTLNSFRASAERHPEVNKYLVPINNRDDIVRATWQFQDGPLPGWKGYYNRYDGYAHSTNALKAVHEACVALGVRFLLGETGNVVEVLYQGQQQSRRATGLRTYDGTTHSTKLVIVAAGAAASNLVPELGAQVVAKSWSVAHVQLTDKEASVLRGIPVTYARDLGFFFEPEYGTNLLKLCPMGGGFINTDQSGVSRPPETVEESQFMPAADEKRVRKLLAQTLPTLANRPLINKTLCWFADTADSDFIIDYVPNTANSVVLLSGDSGHGFKMFPIVGEWVRTLLETRDGKQSVARWRWKSRSEGGNWGADVSWRIGNSEEFRDIRPSPPKANL
ncbi:FAD dependent oxidoreductase [Xylaria cf. heliscus]|nr:FAD dependent oxidoreductase [Xylaria cf. heliscus]